MRRVLVVLGVFAIAAFAADNVWATTVWGISLTITLIWTGFIPTPTTPQDSGGTPKVPPHGKDGYIWLKTGSASPQLFSATVTVAVYYENNTGTSIPIRLETETANCGYPGQFLSTGPIGTGHVPRMGWWK